MIPPHLALVLEDDLEELVDINTSGEGKSHGRTSSSWRTIITYTWELKVGEGRHVIKLINLHLLYRYFIFLSHFQNEI